MSPSWPVSGRTRFWQRCRHKRLCGSPRPAGAICQRRRPGWERGQEKGRSSRRRWREPGSAPQGLAQRAAHPPSRPVPPALGPECQVHRLSREGSMSRDSRASPETCPDFWERSSVGNFPPGTAAREGTASPPRPDLARSRSIRRCLPAHRGGSPGRGDTDGRRAAIATPSPRHRLLAQRPEARRSQGVSRLG